ncbi:MAG: DUF3726 domain-containing protein [Ruegeria sp.]
MSFSLNEVEATAKRATRGAGYSWGQAEEAAKATRWLCAQGVDGTAVLADLLQLGLASNPQDHRPGQIDNLWQGESDLCPLSAGPLLSDCVHLLKDGPVEMKRVVAPVLLLAFVGHAARLLERSLTVEADGERAVTDGVRLTLSETFPMNAKHVTVSFGTAPDGHRNQHTRARPAQDSWDVLNDFARRTYAPATDESRLLGAGAGLSDND